MTRVTPTAVAQRSGSDDLTRARGGREHSKFNIEADLQCLSHGCELAYRRIATSGLERSDDWLGHFHPLCQLQLGQPEVFSGAPDALTDELCMNRRPAGAGHPLAIQARLCCMGTFGSSLGPRRGDLYLLGGHGDRSVAIGTRQVPSPFLAIGVEIYEIAVALTEDGYPNLDELLAAFDELEVLSPHLESGRESIDELSV
jgi:hypothetical protein